MRTPTFTSHERWTLAASMVAACLVPLNSTMIAVALPEIASDLEVSRGTGALLVISYLVAMALLQPLAGRIGDRVGRRRVLLAGLAGFSAASAIAAVAPTFATLLVARGAQAAFGACLIPNIQALVHATMAEGHRGRAFGYLSSGIGAGAAAGPILGGLLVQLAGWRGIFVVNTPIAIGAVVILVRLSASREEVVAHAPRRGDLRNRAFLAACATQAASNAALYSVLLVVPMLLEDREWSGASRGLVLSGLTAGMLLLSPFGGALSDRRGRAYPVLLGMIFGVAGSSVLAAGSNTSALVVAGVLVVGVSMGLSNAPLQAAAIEAVDPGVAARAAGVLSTSRYVGSISGSLAIAALVGDGAEGIQTVLVLIVLASVVAVLAANELRRDGAIDGTGDDTTVVLASDGVS